LQERSPSRWLERGWLALVACIGTATAPFVHREIALAAEITPR
jgi:hypothetical protein